MKKKALSPNAAYMLMITLLCVLTVLLQGIPALSSLSTGVKTVIYLLLFLPAPFFCLFLHKKGRLTERHMTFLILYLGMLLRCYYVALSGLYERQHDVGVYTGISSSQVNPGHIGYTEYIYKFRQLPDFNPYQLYSYYHPPLHYVLSAMSLMLFTALHMPEDLAFENLQALPLFYSGLFLFLTLCILKKLKAHGNGLYTGLLLIALHPALLYMSGSVNNDMLSCVLSACAILASLCYLEDKSLKRLLFIALSLGAGMLCKIHTALMALPVGLLLLLDLTDVLPKRGKARRTSNRTDRACVKSDKSALLRTLRNDLLFGVTAAVTGLSFILRNLILFHVKPGISSASETSVMYTGDCSPGERVGFPRFSEWRFGFPFHSLNGDYNHNTWVILFQTSLFAEEFPMELSGPFLFLCQAAYALAVFFGIASSLYFLLAMGKRIAPGNKHIQKQDQRQALFLLTGYLTFLLFFAIFTVKYPYTCSSDFRYIVICLVYIAAALAMDPATGDRPAGPLPESSSGKSPFFLRFLRAGICFTLLLTALSAILLTQGQR